MNHAARVVVVDRKDQVVGKIIEAPTHEALLRKIDKLEEKGTLVRVDAWLDV